LYFKKQTSVAGKYQGKVKIDIQTVIPKEMDFKDFLAAEPAIKDFEDLNNLKVVGLNLRDDK